MKQQQEQLFENKFLSLWYRLECFPKSAGVESSGAVKDVTGLICLPVLHSGHLARVAGRQSSIFKTDQRCSKSIHKGSRPHIPIPNCLLRVF